MFDYQTKQISASEYQELLHITIPNYTELFRITGGAIGKNRQWILGLHFCDHVCLSIQDKQ